MGKRSSFERNERDFYPTPYEAVLPVLPHLIAPYSARGHIASFIEPCAGDGRLVRHLAKHGMTCHYACDIEPKADFVKKRDVLYFDDDPLPVADLIITNPPWNREVLHPMIEKFRSHAPTWLLFDAGWPFTSQSTPYMRFCHKIVPVGRVKWIENSTMSGKDDCAWYFFMSRENQGFAEFHKAPP